VIVTLRNALPKQPWKFDAAPSVSRARGGPNAVTPESLETGDAVSFNEQETRFHLIDPVLRSKGYDDPQRIMLETPAPVEPTGSKGRRRKGPGRTDYLLCIQSGQMSKPLPLPSLKQRRKRGNRAGDGEPAFCSRDVISRILLALVCVCIALHE
jgi:hypothetical protein